MSIFKTLGGVFQSADKRRTAAKAQKQPSKSKTPPNPQLQKQAPKKHSRPKRSQKPAQLSKQRIQQLEQQAIAEAQSKAREIVLEARRQEPEKTK